MASTVIKTSTPALTPLSGSYDTGATQGVATGGLTFSRGVSRINDFLEGKVDLRFGAGGRADVGTSTPTFTPLSGSYDTGASQGIAIGGLTFSRRSRVYVKLLTPSELPPAVRVLAPPGLGISLDLGPPRLIQFGPPGLPISIGFGSHGITVEVRAPSLEIPFGFGSHVVHAPGIVLVGLGIQFDFTDRAALIGTPGLLAPSLEIAFGFGRHRIGPSDLRPPGLGISIGFGSHAVGGLLEASGLGLDFAFGSHALVSPLRQIASLIIRVGLGSHRIATSDQAFGLYVGGVLRNDVFDHSGGFDISLGLNGQNTMRFTVVDPAGTYRPDIGEQVAFYLADELLFAGFVESLDEGAPTGAQALIRIGVHCNGMSSLLLRRVVFGSWDGDARRGGAGFIASDLTIRFLEEDGVTTDQAPLSQNADGILDQFVLSPTSAFDAFNQIASAAGIDWFMDERRNIRWVDPADGTEDAPFSIDQSLNEEKLFRDSVRVEKLAGQYRNRTFVQLGRGVPTFSEEAASLLPFFEGPVYNLTYPVTETPVIVVTGTLGVHTAEVIEHIPPLPSVGWDFFWQFGEAFITMNPNAPFRDPADAAYIGPIETVEITYSVPDGVTSFVVREDADEIILRQIAEGGGSGKWEAVENATDVDDAAEAGLLAEALNRRYASTGIPQRISYQTDRPGLRPGQKQSIALTRPAASGDFIIESISLAEVSASLRAATPFLRTTVTAVSSRALRAQRQRVRMRRPKADDNLTFVLAKTIPGITNPGLAVGDDVTDAHQVVMAAGLLAYAVVVFADPPVGADVILDVKRLAVGESTWVSIFPLGGKLVVRDGSTSSAITTINLKAARGDRLRVDVEQVGSENPGKDGTLRIREFL